MTQYQSQASAITPMAAGLDVPSPAPMRRVAFASLVGTLIEFYDFLIYGIAAALVFPKVFFPALGTSAGTVASFATLGVAFIARPFGSILFGHFGDRLGRKTTLITTLLLMGVATVIVGALPTADQIGMAAPIFLVFLRVLQGIAAGGEWAGAVLFAAENAPKSRRGYWAMFPTFGASIALVLANLTFLLSVLWMSNEAFLSWGWRIPFLASVLLLAVGLWVRLKTHETPVFTKEVNRVGVVRVPLVEAIKHQGRDILLAIGVPVVFFSFTYLGASYLIAYGATVIKLAQSQTLLVGMAGGTINAIGVLLGAMWSDRIGRRRVLLTVSFAAIAWSLVLFAVLGHGSVWSYALGVCITMLISGLGFGPAAALVSEIFQTRYRYTGAAISYNLAGVIGGAVPPLLAVTIVTTYGGFVFGMLLAGLGVISFLCCLAIGETRHNELDEKTAPRA